MVRFLFEWYETAAYGSGIGGSITILVTIKKSIGGTCESCRRPHSKGTGGSIWPSKEKESVLLLMNAFT
jgi:hypothetical protein